MKDLDDERMAYGRFKHQQPILCIQGDGKNRPLPPFRRIGKSLICPICQMRGAAEVIFLKLRSNVDVVAELTEVEIDGSITSPAIAVLVEEEPILSETSGQEIF